MDNNIKPKDPLVALLLTIFLTGLGQVYAGRILRGVIFFCISFVGILVLTLYIINAYTKISAGTLILIFIVLCFGIYVIIDAYLCARKYNVDKDVTRRISAGRRIGLIFGILFLLFLLNPSDFIGAYLINNVVQSFKVSSGAMRPTIMQGDRIFVDKAIYKRSEPKRGDLVVYSSPQNLMKKFVKRLVGLPNEMLEIKDGMVFIDGVALKEPAAIVDKRYHNAGDYGKENVGVKIPENNYYMLGDNTAASLDSRYEGFVTRKDIIGKAYKIYYPFTRSGPIE